MKNNEIENEIDDIKKWEEKIKQKDLIYRANKYKYDFQQYETIRSFGKSSYTVDAAEEDQSNLSEEKQNLIINLYQKPKKIRKKI